MYLTDGTRVFRQEDNGSLSSIPLDETNYAYREYLAWLAEGNTPQLYVDPAGALTAGQARIQRQISQRERKAQKLARKGDTLGALKLLNNL